MVDEDERACVRACVRSRVHLPYHGMIIKTRNSLSYNRRPVYSVVLSPIPHLHKKLAGAAYNVGQHDKSQCESGSWAV